MSNSNEINSLEIFQSLIANVNDIFLNLEKAIQLEENTYYSDETEENQLLFEAVFSFIKVVIKNKPASILNARLPNQDNVLHFLLQKKFHTQGKVITEVLKNFPQLAMTRGGDNKTPFHSVADDFDLNTMSVFLQACPQAASILNGKNTILGNFTRQFSARKKYSTYRNSNFIEQSIMEALPEIKVNKSLQSNLAKILQQLVDAFPGAVFFKSDDGHLPIENIYHRYIFQNVIYFSSCGEYLQPLLNSGGGINANFPVGLTFQGHPLFSNMTNVFRYKLLIGAKLAGVPITQNTLGFESAICSLSDLKKMRLFLKKPDINQLYKIVNRAIVFLDKNDPSFQELLSIKNYLFFEKSPTLFFICVNYFADQFRTNNLKLEEVVNKLPEEIKEPVIEASKGLMK